MTFSPEEKTLTFYIRDFEPGTQRLLMSTLDINGLILDLAAFKLVVARHISEIVKDPTQLELAHQVASKGQVLPLTRDETNALNFQYNSYSIQLSNVGKEASTDPMKKICIDFDNTLSAGHSKGQVESPTEGAIEALRKLKQEGYTIVIYSCRANSAEGKKQIEEWLKKYDCPHDEIFVGKPMAIAYVDDRAIAFKGNWAEVLKEISALASTAHAFNISGELYDGSISQRSRVVLVDDASKRTDGMAGSENQTSSALSRKEVNSTFMPSLPGVVWETHDGPDMQHSPSTPLEMLHPVNQDNVYDTYTTIHDKHDPADLIHFLSLKDKAKKPELSQDAKDKDVLNVAQNTLETTLGKHDIAKKAATNEEHMAHIKGLVGRKQFDEAVSYILDNKLQAPKLLKELEERSSRATILNKDQALLLLEKGSLGAQANAVKWLAKNNNINELAAIFPVIALNPSIAKDIINVFKMNKNVIVLNRLFSDKSIPTPARLEVLEALSSIKYTPIVDEAIIDESEQIRSLGYKIASQTGKFQLLHKGLDDSSPKIRKEIYTYLWESQSLYALDLFGEGLKDPDPLIQNFVKEKLGVSNGVQAPPVPKGDELTPKIIEEAVEDANEYFKKNPELGTKLVKDEEERQRTMHENRKNSPPNEWKKLWEEGLAKGLSSDSAAQAANAEIARRKEAKSSLEVEAIQPPAGISNILEPAFEWGERDDGLLGKDVKQFYGRPKSEFRNDMNLLPEFLKQMFEDPDMDKHEEDFVQPVKLGAGNTYLPPGTPFKLKVNLSPLPKGTPGYILWPDKIQPYNYNPTVYAVWLQGVEADFKEGDILLPEDMMDFEMPVAKAPSKEEIEAPESPKDVKVMDPKDLRKKRDELLDKMLAHPEGSPERKKWEDRLRAMGMLSKKEANVYDNFEMEQLYRGQETERVEHDEGILIMDKDYVEDTQTFPKGVPSPPARWVNPDREEGEIGGEKLPNGPTYWEPSPGNLDCMPASNTISLTIEFHNDGGKIFCSWDKGDIAPHLDEEKAVAALTNFIQTNLPHVMNKFKAISPEHVDMHNRTLVLKFTGASKEPNEKK